jgi:hypothetical protein
VCDEEISLKFMKQKYRIAQKSSIMKKKAIAVSAAKQRAKTIQLNNEFCEFQFYSIEAVRCVLSNYVYFIDHGRVERSFILGFKRKLSTVG